MHARDLVAPFPAVTSDSPVIEATRQQPDNDLPGLAVLDTDGLASTALPGTQVLRMAVPRYCQDDPTLARVADEANADQSLRALAGSTVRACLPDEPRELVVIDPDAAVLEIAAFVPRTRNPADQGARRDVITLDRLFVA